MGHDSIILISSVSKKIPLIEAVRKAMEKMERKAWIVGADSDPSCIGTHFVDAFWCMPKLHDLSGETLISTCRKLGVQQIIPTRDGELAFYAKHKMRLAEAGIHVMVSDFIPLQACLDKFHFYETLSNAGFPAIPTALTPDEISTPLYVVKERFGAGGVSVGLQLPAFEARKHAMQLKNPIFQPYIAGKEVSVDLYLDNAKTAKGVVARTRDYVVNGESQVTSTFRNEVLEKMCTDMAELLQLSGHVMFQLIQDEQDDLFHVLECNPRFGGASTLSLEVGLESFYWNFLEANGESLADTPFERSPEEKTLIRYPKDMIKEKL